MKRLLISFLAGWVLLTAISVGGTFLGAIFMHGEPRVLDIVYLPLALPEFVYNIFLPEYQVKAMTNGRIGTTIFIVLPNFFIYAGATYLFLTAKALVRKRSERVP